MVVYVDNWRTKFRYNGILGRWSHLFADTTEELEEFRTKLGLDSTWVIRRGHHDEHYRIVDRKRTQAIQLGALPVSYPDKANQILRKKIVATR